MPRNRQKGKHESASKEDKGEAGLWPSWIKQRPEPSYSRLSEADLAPRGSPDNSITKAELIQLTKKKSFKEQIEKFFPPYVHPALEEMGVSTIEDAYFLAIEDLVSSPSITRV